MKGKPFKETKLGSFLSKAAPTILDVAGTAWPPVEIIRNLLFKEKANMTPEQQAEADRLLLEYEKEIFTLEVQDRDSARKRELGYVEATKHADYMQITVGACIIFAFLGVEAATIFYEVPVANRDQFIHITSIVDVSLGLVVGYYFGSSKGSADKDRQKQHAQ